METLLGTRVKFIETYYGKEPYAVFATNRQIQQQETVFLNTIESVGDGNIKAKVIAVVYPVKKGVDKFGLPDRFKKYPSTPK